MIEDRYYKAKDGELIYHYCGADAFAQIVRTQTMWHTAFTALNDATERKWGYEQFEDAANKLRESFGAEFIDNIIEIVRLTRDHSIAMIASYSLDGDVLSQWRAYADDGRGYAIGFSSRELILPAKSLRVLYDRAAQRRELTGNIKHVFQTEKNFGFRYDEKFFQHWLRFGLDLCAYKHHAFAEEQEVRTVHITGLALNENERRIIPLGAVDSHGVRRAEPALINYRARNGVQIPYVSLDITDGGKNSPIKEIVLGPRNPDTEENVGTFLTTVGRGGVKIRRSDAPYR